MAQYRHGDPTSRVWGMLAALYEAIPWRPFLTTGMSVFGPFFPPEEAAPHPRSKIQMLDETAAHALAVQVNESLQGTPLRRHKVLSIEGQDIVVETNEVELVYKTVNLLGGALKMTFPERTNLPKVVRIGPVILAILPHELDPDHLRDPSVQELQDMMAAYTKQLGRLYADHQANIFFITPQAYAPGEYFLTGMPLSFHAVNAAAALVAHAQAHDSEVSLDVGSGSDALLARIQMGLGARAVLIDKDASSLALARLYLDSDGWRPGLNGDYVFLEGDLTDEAFVEHVLLAHPWVQAASAAAINMGPWEMYVTRKDQQRIHPNDKALELIHRLPFMRFVLNAGYALPTHQTVLDRVQGDFEQAGFTVDRVDYPHGVFPLTATALVAERKTNPPERHTLAAS